MAVLPTLTKTTTSTNVTPGTPVNFTVTLVIEENATTTILFFNDSLPQLRSGSKFTLESQSLPNIFELVNNIDGTQNLTTPTGVIPPGTYFITIQANTTEADAGAELPNAARLDYTVGESGGTIIARATATVALCIHGSSMISLPNNEQIEISKLQPGQLILGADGKCTNIIEAVPCWTLNNKCGDCIIFEKDSIAPNVPSSRFAVDAGHPIFPRLNEAAYVPCLIEAKSFVNNKNIYIVKWEDVKYLLPGENKRYDIIMKGDSCKAYIANGMAVKARQERKIPGYSYV